MDPKKTGAFIAALRKQMGMTQRALADILHVSDKAISRWETGKGFPETGLLKALSDTLGVSVGELLGGKRMQQEQIKEQTDLVIVQSFHKSDKSTTAMIWTAVGAVLLIIILVCVWIVTAMPKEMHAMDFIHSSSIRMLYDLGDDNVEPHIEYPDLSYREFDGGYEYYAHDGTERYVFTYIPEFSGEPVMSYMHCSAEESPLFGVLVGESTLVEKNAVLGVEKDYSLMQYLKD